MAKKNELEKIEKFLEYNNDVSKKITELLERLLTKSNKKSQTTVLRLTDVLSDIVTLLANIPEQGTYDGRAAAVIMMVNRQLSKEIAKLLEELADKAGSQVASPLHHLCWMLEKIIPTLEMRKATDRAGKRLGRFRYPPGLKNQCEKLNIPLDTLELPRRSVQVFVDKIVTLIASEKFYHEEKCRIQGHHDELQWDVNGKAYRRSEHAVLAYFESKGYKGFFDEGRSPHMILEYACGKRLGAVNENRPLLVDAVRRATPDKIRKNVCGMGYLHRVPNLYHDTDNEKVITERFLALWNSIGGEGWAKILEACYEYCSFSVCGWPDLTIAQDNFLRFIEIKTSSGRLNKKQEKTISKFLLPLGFSVSVLQLVPLK